VASLENNANHTYITFVAAVINDIVMMPILSTPFKMGIFQKDPDGFF